MESNFAGRYPFDSLCKICDLLQAARGGGAKENILKQLFDHWRKHGGDGYTLLRLLLPDQDRVRPNYKVKESFLAKIYKEALYLADNAEDAYALKNWSTPGISSRYHGDFAMVAYEVISKRSTVTAGRQHVSVDAVNAKLDQLSRCADNKAREDVIKWAFNAMRPAEQKWLIRIILKDLKLGISERTVLKVWHPDAVQLWNTSTDLEAVAKLTNPEQRLTGEQMQLQVFQPFRPMFGLRLHSLANLPDTLKAFQKPYCCQEKVDGERMLMHYKNGEFRYYSRNTIEWSDDYGRNITCGSFTQYVGEFFHTGVRDFVLDGEMVAVDRDTNVVLPFGTVRHAQGGGAHSATHPKYFVFDLLLCNGVSLIRFDLKTRVKYLREYFRSNAQWLEILPLKEVNSPEDVLAELNNIYEAKGEGIIIKDPCRPYFPGERPPSWIKVKIDYEPELLEPLDLMVVGGSWGEGKRGQQLASFLLAVRQGKQWVSFVKVGSGYSMGQLMAINDKLLDKAVQLDSNAGPPPWLILQGNSKERPDVVIRPEDSLVFEITAAELTASTEFAAQASLRFPRVRSVRHDKGIDDAVTMDDLREVWKRTGGRLTRQPTMDLFAKRKRDAVRKPTARSQKRIASHIHTVDVDDAAEDVFGGRAFVVRAHPAAQGDLAAANIQRLLLSHGATIHANPVDNSSAKTFAVVAASDQMPDIRRMQQLDKFDIVKLAYITECIKEGKLLPLLPKWTIAMSPATQATLRGTFDVWGDSYTDDCTQEELSILLDHMAAPDVVEQTAQQQARVGTKRSYVEDAPEALDPLTLVFAVPPSADQDARAAKLCVVDEMDYRYGIPEHGGGMPLTWFRRMCFYCDTQYSSATAEASITLAQTRIIMYGGELGVGLLDKQVTHVLVDHLNSDREFALRAELVAHGASAKRFVDTAWIQQCCEEQTRLPE
ncbi:DNA ligase (ATP) [Sorochytrium milnesiophthora]